MINSGNKIVGDVIEDTAKTISKDLSRGVSRFLNTPDTVNNNGTRNVLAGRVDYKNNNGITRFFMDSTQRQTEYSVSSIYFAEPCGRFIGVEISSLYPDQNLWNVSISSQETNGIYTDFEVNTNGTAGSKIGELKPYDPRARDCYINAVANPDRPVWSEVYTDFNQPCHADESTGGSRRRWGCDWCSGC